MIQEFLGRPLSYWVEVQRRIDAQGPIDVHRLLLEVSELRGRVSVYESRIREMNQLIPPMR